MPPATRSGQNATWRGGGEASITRYYDEAAAEGAERWLEQLVVRFDVEPGQVRRADRYVVLLGPVEQPAERDC